jgi:hypothetical protein
LTRFGSPPFRATAELAVFVQEVIAVIPMAPSGSSSGIDDVATA